MAFILKKGRNTELQHGIILFIMGVFLFLTDPKGINILDKFNIVYSIGTVISLSTIKLWALAFITVSTIRFIALWVNGRSPIGSPIARIISSVLTSIFLVVFSMGMLHYPSSLIIVYFVMIVFELFIIWNATRDLKYACTTIIT